MVTSSLALVFKMSSLHVLYLLFPKSPRFLDWSIDAVTGSLYVEFSWFLFTIFVVLCSLLNSPDVFLKLTLTGHEQNALQG